MKFNFFIPVLTFIISCNVYAITYEVIGPCSATPAYSGTYALSDLKESVGKVSVAIFDRQQIPYNGNSDGFSSILNTPTGRESIEVISDTKMRAHGWCYSVNGIGPDVLAGDYFFTSDADKVVWFFGYSTYDHGQWTDYCVPSYTVHAAQFCTK